MFSLLNALRPRRYRLPLPLRVRVRKHRGEPPSSRPMPILSEETVTENISSAGCYFLLTDTPPVGSKAEMEITLPPRLPGVQTAKVLCSGKVVRVEDTQAMGKVGVACTIEHYQFLTESHGA